MASLNFPDSPILGQIFSGSIVNWKWNGTVWSPISLGGSSVGVSTDSIWDTKGDLVVGTGSNTATKLPVSSVSGQLLSSDSSTSTGLKWVNPFTLNHPFHSWVFGSWNCDTTSTTPGTYNTSTATTRGTGTAVASTSSRARNISYVSVATTGNDAGTLSNTSTLYLTNEWRILVWAGLDTLTNIRYGVGVVASSSTITASDDGANGEGAWFRYSTNAGDTTWQCITSNDTAGGPTITDTGVTVTTGTKIFEIHKTASEIKFFLDNVLVATHTTDLPDNSDTLTLCPGLARTLANAAATVHFVQCAISYRIP